jgi:tetratricopeptide (TPR) repeat protein
MTRLDMAKVKKAVGQDKKPASATLESLLAMAAAMGGGEEESELDRAQEKAFAAMEASSRRKRIALAKEALAISPLCADAYSVLAWEAEAKPAEALALYRQAVEAGTQALGDDAFEQDAGLFWGLLETRPYMRARHGLARALWENGNHDEAVAHYQDMLRLNPDDNQGIRYSLLDALLELGRDAAAGGLLRQYKDDGAAAWAWSEALLAFRKKGNAAPSRKALARAVDANPHVPAYLLGRQPLPRDLPRFIGIGDESEAVSYVHDADAAWNAATGAKAWVAASLVIDTQALPETRPDAEADAVNERVDEAVLALLLLGLHDGARARKSFDWAAMDRLHAKGLISNPAGRAKSVVFSEEGLRLAQAAYDALLVKGQGKK